MNVNQLKYRIDTAANIVEFVEREHVNPTEVISITPYGDMHIIWYWQHVLKNKELQRKLHKPLPK
jgi:hypothetical protein